MTRKQLKAKRREKAKKTAANKARHTYNSVPLGSCKMSDAGSTAVFLTVNNELGKFIKLMKDNPLTEGKGCRANEDDWNSIQTSFNKELGFTMAIIDKADLEANKEYFESEWKLQPLGSDEATAVTCLNSPDMVWGKLEKLYSLTHPLATGFANPYRLEILAQDPCLR